MKMQKTRARPVGGTQLNYLDMPTMIKAHIQHAFKENFKFWENNSERLTRMMQAK
jgi:hypothetical protein